MKNKRVGNRRKGRILCWMLTVVMLLTSVQVSASAFDASDVFSSGDRVSSGGSPSGGSASDGGTSGGIAGAGSASDGAAANPGDVFSDGLPEGNAGLGNDNTAADNSAGAGNAANSVSGTNSGSTANAAIGTHPEGSTDADVVLFGEETPGTGSLIHIGDPVVIRFADNTGKSYYEDLEIETKVGETIQIPGVPEFEDAEGSGWKLDLEAPDDGILIEGGEPLTLSMEEDLIEYIVDGVLTLYAVEGKDMCLVTFYNNSGTAVFNGGQMKIAKGDTISLPDFPNSKYVNFGWTLTRGSSTVQYKIGEKFTVSKNVSLYMVRYAVSKVMSVTFLNPSGSTNAALKALNTNVLKNNKLKLPAVPAASGYTNLGWSTKKNDTKAVYLAGQSIKITKNLKLYAVRKKLPTYTVAFNNNSGTSTSKTYSKLNQKVAKNTYIILPELPKAAGYQNVGWTTTLKGTKPVYKAGTKIKVTKNMKFYTVRTKSKYYTVTFYLGNGSTNTAYKALQKKKIEEDTMITLPSIPDRAGYLNLGWSLSKNATVPGMREGQKYNVTKNLSFYAVQRKSVSLVLHYNNGTVYRTLSVSQGDSFVLPSVSNKAGYTFMGWSESPNQTVAPKYEAGESIKIMKATDLYAVVFNRALEPEVTADTLSQPDLRKYEKVIFVGDSRTNRMALTLNQQFDSSLTQGITFISREGEGYSWLKSQGYTALLSAVGEGSTSILSKKTAVIFNLGVNDLWNTANYVNYMNSLASELKEKGCVLFYMSVNPVNSKMITASGHSTRAEADVRKFNDSIRLNLCTGGKYTYIDTYKMLMESGFGTNSGRGVDSNTDDGLHYTTKTYKRIYNYCLSEINRYGIR